MTLTRAAMPAASRLARWIPKLAGIPALVWGDFVLDEYWRCATRRVSREAPVLVLEWQSRAAQGGGAANAALNLAALGARVAVAGYVGDDAAGRELAELLVRGGVDPRGLVAHPTGATVVKTRIVAGSSHTARQQVVRVDRGAAFPALPVLRRELRAAVERGRHARAVVLSDYGYDSVTPELARRWRGVLRGATLGLDARYRLAHYRGVTLATPNEGEAADAAGVAIAGEAELERAARALRRALKARCLIVTRGRDGLTLWRNGEGVSLDAFGDEEAVDVTGAGDAVVATATLALAAGASPLEAAALANVAGSVAVSRRGAVAVSAADLRAALGAAARVRARARTRV